MMSGTWRPQDSTTDGTGVELGVGWRLGVGRRRLGVSASSISTLAAAGLHGLINGMDQGSVLWAFTMPAAGFHGLTDEMGVEMFLLLLLSIPSILTLAPAGLCGPTDETGVETFRCCCFWGAQHCQFSPWQLQVCGCQEREQGWCPCCPSPGWLLWPDARWLRLDCPLSPPCHLPPPTLPSPPCRGEKKEKGGRKKKNVCTAGTTRLPSFLWKSSPLPPSPVLLWEK